MFENIPKNWKKYKLKDLYYILRGGSPRPIDKYLTSDPNGINWIKIGDAKVGSKFIESTKEKIIPEGKNKSRFVNVGDFILSNSMSFGRPYIMKTEGCIHDGWLVLKEKEKNIIYKDFVYYLLCSKQVHSQFENAAAGGVVSNLNIQRVENVEVVIPNDIREQKEIADVLDAASEIIRLRTTCIESAQSLIPALFQEMFGNMIDKNENLVSIGSLIEETSQVNPQKLFTDEFLYIDISSINNETGIIESPKVIKIDNIPSRARKLVKVDDILVAMTRPYLKGFAIVPENLNNNIASTGFSILRAQKEKIIPKYLYAYIRTDYFVNQLIPKMRGANYPAVTDSNVKSVKIPLPDIKLQKLFAAKVQEIEAYIKTQQVELENAKTMFQSLLHHSFTGELTRHKFGGDANG